MDYGFIIGLLLWLLRRNFCIEVLIKIKDENVDDNKSYTNGVSSWEEAYLGRGLNEKSCKLNRRNKVYFIQVTVGNPGRDYLLKLTTLFQGISLIDIKRNRKGFNSTLSSTYTSIKANHTNFLGSGVISSDTLRIGELNIQIDAVPFFLAKSTHYAATLYPGLFGIAYDTEDQSDDNHKSVFDFIAHLPQINPRFHQLLGLKALNASEGLMTIGELPEHILSNYKLYHKCPLLSIQGRHSWSCRLNAIYFEDLFFYQLNHKMDFTLGGSTMSVPKELYMILQERYFKEEFDNESCHFDDEELYTRFGQIVCHKEFDVKRIGVISFVFGKWTVKIPSEKLFYYARDSVYFSIVYDNDGDESLFMSPILLYDYSLFFDKENRHLGFYYSKTGSEG